MISSLAAQWPNALPRGFPRTPDGKPDLYAAPPKLPDGRPDFSGIWHADNNRLQFNLLADGPVDLLPEAAEIYKQRLAGRGKDRPSAHCLPHTVPDAMIVPSPFKFVHTPGLTLILYEEFIDFRQIFTDGRALPQDPLPAWFGYSIGRWEGKDFVIESSGFNDRSWLDDNGHPHSEALRTTERFRRLNYGQMLMEITINDPKSYAKPWSATVTFHLLPDIELTEYICEDPNPDTVAR
ncbi:MAG: hypothetical protein ABL995_05435 [Bryobacteraceae bacterium]